jgi:hypothetical protein
MAEKTPLTQEERAKIMVNMIVNGVKTPDDLYAICARFIESRDGEVEMEVKRERERIKNYLRGKEIVATDADGNKETMIRVGNFLAALEEWPDLPETTY